MIVRGYSGSSEDVHYVFVYNGEDKSLCDTFTAVKGPYVQNIQCRDTVGQSVTVEVNNYINMYEIEIYGRSFGKWGFSLNILNTKNDKVVI